LVLFLKRLSVVVFIFKMSLILKRTDID
jgi:hypothetical protein